MDKNTQNPRLYNLEWCTRKENLYDSYKTLSPNRNYKQCTLLKNHVEIGKFKGIERAAKFATDNFAVNKSSLSKYLSCGEFEIRIEGKTNGSVIYHNKTLKKFPIQLFKNEVYLGEFKSITKAYQYIYDNFNIKITKIKPLNIYTIKGFTIKRINDKSKCNDYPL